MRRYHRTRTKRLAARLAVEQIVSRSTNHGGFEEHGQVTAQEQAALPVPDSWLSQPAASRPGDVRGPLVQSSERAA